MKKIVLILGCSFAIGINAQWTENGSAITTTDIVGVGTTSPLASFHVMKEDAGVKSQFSMSMLEATDAQLDIVSSSGGTWGSAINFIEGNGVSNTNVWSLVRQTTLGSGDSGLHINYGTQNRHDNTTYVTFKNDGKVGIGTAVPSQKLEIYNSNLFNTNMNPESQDHISFTSNTPGIGNFFGGITWKTGSRRRAAIAAVQEHTDSDHIGLAFFTQGTDGPGPIYESLRIARNGNIGIGTTTPDAKLAVNGNIHAKEVKVDLMGWPDYVFKKGHDLPTLKEVEKHIQEKGHLINIPSASEVEENGIQLGEMNKLLLEKIEELTLYVIELKKENQNQQKEIEQLKKQKK
ncbi:hypothetical protein [Flagellimonas nanhaiensis]|uniref:Tail fiber domain-containing protein n=1 Tax=Flagellimonas nanhaiensis TaxID=2292706 RepID=A0A371JSI1_9FLAO|nr:hypothetical protein [Allomuricauda nanhaiensis]RDY60773.1 hypothetical protein DX873_00905 [Allomuricauda nanhaiensis]